MCSEFKCQSAGCRTPGPPCLCQCLCHCTRVETQAQRAFLLASRVQVHLDSSHATEWWFRGCCWHWHCQKHCETSSDIGIQLLYSWLAQGILQSCWVLWRKLAVSFLTSCSQFRHQKWPWPWPLWGWDIAWGIDHAVSSAFHWALVSSDWLKVSRVLFASTVWVCWQEHWLHAVDKLSGAMFLYQCFTPLPFPLLFQTARPAPSCHLTLLVAH